MSSEVKALNEVIVYAPIKPDYYKRTVPLNADYLPIVYYKKPYNVHRRAKFILFSSLLKQHDKFLAMEMLDRFKLIELIERSCFNYTIDKARENNIPTKWDNDDFQYIYIVIASKIASNIDQTNMVKNTYLPNAILDGNIDITQLPRMTSLEMFPDKYKTVLSKLEMSKNVAKTVRTTAMYTCRRCKKSECTYENLYNRSLDEGVNLIITCISCGLEFKA